MPFLRNASPLSKPDGEGPAALLAAIEACGAPPAAALESAIAADAGAYLAGIEAYRAHPYRRPPEVAPVLWREGTSRLIDYGGDAAAGKDRGATLRGAPRRGRGGPAILVVPSLINRSYVLDLLPERSFLRYLAGRGLRPLLLDWGAPGAVERRFTLTDYIAGRLCRAFDAAREIAGKPIFLLGYCMGGLLALALARLRHRDVAALLLLATPWDFHAERADEARLFGLAAEYFPLLCAGTAALPVDVVQSFFFLLDPLLAHRKFVRFAALSPASEEARRFVALEDWVNDGVPLAQRVAEACARSWYGANEPYRGLWCVAGKKIRPERLRLPVLVVLPVADRIVPPGSAAPLAALFADASVLRPPLGHVGMMAGNDAQATLWAPLADWVLAQSPKGLRAAARWTSGSGGFKSGIVQRT